MLSLQLFASKSAQEIFVVSVTNLQRHPIGYFSVAITAYPWNKTEYPPTFTGFPLHIIQLTELCTLQLKLDDVKAFLMKVIVTVMEKRGSASSTCNTNKITKEIEGLRKMIEDFTASRVARANAKNEATTKKSLNSLLKMKMMLSTVS